MYIVEVDVRSAARHWFQRSGDPEGARGAASLRDLEGTGHLCSLCCSDAARQTFAAVNVPLHIFLSTLDRNHTSEVVWSTGDSQSGQASGMETLGHRRRDLDCVVHGRQPQSVGAKIGKISR